MPRPQNPLGVTPYLLSKHRNLRVLVVIHETLQYELQTLQQLYEFQLTNSS